MVLSILRAGTVYIPQMRKRKRKKELSNRRLFVYFTQVYYNSNHAVQVGLVQQIYSLVVNELPGLLRMAALYTYLII